MWLKNEGVYVPKCAVKGLLFPRVQVLSRQGASRPGIQYNRASSRTSRTNLVGTSGNDELYSYDGLERLIDMARGNHGGGTTISNATFAQSWGLDATGNWPVFRQVDMVTPSNCFEERRTANPANEITALSRLYGPGYAKPTYDRAGNMISIPPGTSGIYDAWNRLVRTSLPGQTFSYLYDGLGRRVTKTINSSVRHYYYSSDWQVLEERTGASTSPERQFLWGLRYIDDLVLRDRAPSGSGSLTERFYALQDANWNVTAIADSAGDVQERYRYSPYGVVTFLNSTFDPRSPNESSYGWEILFTGQRLEINYLAYICLYKYRRRDYHATIGLFLTRDPLGHKDGMNVYAYVRQSPINYVDPQGLVTFNSSPTASAPWYRDEGNTGTYTVVVFSYECEKCDCEMYRVKFTIDFEFYIVLNPAQLLDKYANLPGTYGHEQRHVENYRKHLEEAKDVLAKIEEMNNCTIATMEECDKIGSTYTDLFHRSSLLFKAIEMRHGHPTSPKNDTPYPPIGQMPGNPSRPPN